MVPETLAERQLHFNEDRIRFRQPEKLLHRPDNPAGRLQSAITDCGVCCVFFRNTSRTTTASVSALYMTRNVPASSLIRNSWHRGPMAGMGRECGSPRDSPCCNNLSKYPVSSCAACEKAAS